MWFHRDTSGWDNKFSTARISCGSLFHISEKWMRRKFNGKFLLKIATEPCDQHSLVRTRCKLNLLTVASHGLYVIRVKKWHLVLVRRTKVAPNSTRCILIYNWNSDCIQIVSEESARFSLASTSIRIPVSGITWITYMFSLRTWIYMYFLRDPRHTLSTEVDESNVNNKNLHFPMAKKRSMKM